MKLTLLVFSSLLSQMVFAKAFQNSYVAFEVPDTYAAADFLRRKNVPIVSGPKERPDGAVQVFATDPDGHVVELCSPPR